MQAFDVPHPDHSMLRRFVALLLAVAYAAGQLVAMPHAHAAEASRAHVQPHIHGSGAGGHGHHHHQQVHETSRTDESGDPSYAAISWGHDDDCIFLPDSLSASDGSKVKGYESLAQTSAPILAARLSLAPPAGRSFFMPPLNALPSGADLCLMLRNLRI